MKQDISVWRGFSGYIGYIWRKDKKLFLYGILLIPAFALADYLTVYLPKMVVLAFEQGKSIPGLAAGVLLTVALLLLCKLVCVTGETSLKHGNRKINRRMIDDFTKKLLYVDYKYLEDADFLSVRNMVHENLFGGQIGNDQKADRLEEFLHALFHWLAAVGTVALYAVYVSLLNPWLLLLLPAVPLGLLFNTSVPRKIELKWAKRGGDAWKKIDYITKKTEDFSMAKDIRMYGMDSWFMSLSKKYRDKRLYFKGREMRASAYGGIVNMTASGVYYIIFDWYVLQSFLRGSMNTADMIFYLQMGVALLRILTDQINSGIADIAKISLGFNRYKNFMAYGENTGVVEVPVKSGMPEIELRHVSFSYPGSDKKILDDFNMKVNPGEKIAIVGVNGAGKTTLMKLICGLLHPDSGQILLNGTDMEEMQAEERYAWFSCVFQDIQFLPLSIGENISMQRAAKGDETREADGATCGSKRIGYSFRKGDETREAGGATCDSKRIRYSFRKGDEAREADGATCDRDAERTEQRIWSCLEKAGMREAVERLPQKLDTLMEKSLNEDAVDFSGGQRQKLILARALYRDAGVLILDEPTASLDALAENDIYEKYAEFAKDKTSFFVSHRLSSTRFCDRIFLIDRGVVAEEGTHGELLASGGLYAEMFAMQSKYYKETAT